MSARVMAGRILVVEDDEWLARSLRRLLAHEEFYVETVGSAEEALDQLAVDPGYDLMILDVTLPGLDGIACCKQLRANRWRQPILILTARQGLGDKLLGFEQGADDYLAKPFDSRELIARVRAQLRRARDYNSSEGAASRVDLAFGLVLDTNLRDALVHGVPARLTSREYELLSLLARYPNIPLQTRWIYQQVWGCAPDSGMKRLAVTIRRLRIKIENQPDEPAYILTVRGYGYKLRGV